MCEKKRALVISGGMIEEDFALSFCRENKYDILIAADRGLEFYHRNHLPMTHIVGDFDSAAEVSPDFYKDRPEIRIRKFKPEKDWTDTEIAVSLAMEEGCKEIDIIGGTGTRLDHVLGNVQVLALALEAGVRARLIDSHNRITLHKEGLILKKEEAFGKYISLFAFGGPVTGLTLTGFKYNVEDFFLNDIGSRAVSNEICENVAEISFTFGRLLVIESCD